MLSYLYHALEAFRSSFSRQRSGLLLSAVIISFIAVPEMIGVTSMCRFWRSDEHGYQRLLHFFRSTAYRYTALLQSWQRWVLRQHVEVQVNGRCVLLGDHTHVVKDGGRMPGVVSLRETSQTQSKPSYFRGPCWGAVGVLVGTLSGCFCLPLQLQIHLGFRHLGVEEAAEPGAQPNLAERVVQMALVFAIGHDRAAL